jgi:hypothetical protein
MSATGCHPPCGPGRPVTGFPFSSAIALEARHAGRSVRAATVLVVFRPELVRGEPAAIPPSAAGSACPRSPT